MGYNPTHLRRWHMPRDYFGAEWPEYYSAGVGKSRDSDALERSNFAVMRRELEKVAEPPDWPHDESPWTIVRESHWAVGWVEWIAIHQDAADALRVADELAASKEDYPVLDEEHFSEVENEDCRQVWEDCFNRRDRVKYFRNHGHSGDVATLLRAVRGSWCDAGNALNCPSDILC